MTQKEFDKLAKNHDKWAWSDEKEGKRLDIRCEKCQLIEEYTYEELFGKEDE